MKIATVLFLLASIVAISSARDITNPDDLTDEDYDVISNESEDEDDEPVKPSTRASNPKKTGCFVRIAKLGDQPQPLFLQPGSNKQWPVSDYGDMELSAGDNLELFCTSTYVNPPNKSGSQTATCVSGVFFNIDKVKYNMTEVTCKDWPAFTARKTGEKCNGGVMIETGFQVAKRFVKQLEICFNEDEQVPRYVHHTLSPQSTTFQSNVGRPIFTKGGFYARKNVDRLYTQKGQLKTLKKKLGNIADELVNTKKNLYLARGHLAAKADFIYGSEQRGTFLFMNAAPQWQVFNAGNWQRVEDNTRQWVAKKKMNVECWTGTYGVTTLPNDNGVETPIYLDYDNNGNGLLPVPKLYFRVIIEPKTKRGVVLIGVNNPFLTMGQIEKDYIICNDVSDKLDFLTWKQYDITSGYSYACEVKDFAKKNPNLPKFDVKSLLY